MSNAYAATAAPPKHQRRLLDQPIRTPSPSTWTSRPTSSVGRGRQPRVATGEQGLERRTRPGPTPGDLPCAIDEHRQGRDGRPIGEACDPRRLRAFGDQRHDGVGVARQREGDRRSTRSRTNRRDAVRRLPAPPGCSRSSRSDGHGAGARLARRRGGRQLGRGVRPVAASAPRRRGRRSRAAHADQAPTRVVEDLGRQAATARACRSRTAASSSGPARMSWQGLGSILGLDRRRGSPRAARPRSRGSSSSEQPAHPVARRPQPRRQHVAAYSNS